MTQENYRINRQDRENHVPRTAYPKQRTTLNAEAVHLQRVLLGVFHPCLWPLKIPVCTLGTAGCQASHQPSDPSTPAFGQAHQKTSPYLAAAYISSLPDHCILGQRQMLGRLLVYWSLLVAEIVDYVNRSEEFLAGIWSPIVTWSNAFVEDEFAHRRSQD